MNGLEIKSQQPILFLTTQAGLTLQQIQAVLPEAISIVGSFVAGSTYGQYGYWVLMPYKFKVPHISVYGDRIQVGLFSDSYPNPLYSPELGTSDEIIAQRVDFIADYYH